MIRIFNKKNLNTFTNHMNTLNTKIINETSSNSDYLWNILVSESKNAYNDSFPLIKKAYKNVETKSG